MLYTQRYEADLIKNPFSASERQIPLLKIWLPINKPLKRQKTSGLVSVYGFKCAVAETKKWWKIYLNENLKKDPDHKMIWLWEVLA